MSMSTVFYCHNIITSLVSSSVGIKLCPYHLHRASYSLIEPTSSLPGSVRKQSGNNSGDIIVYSSTIFETID